MLREQIGDFKHVFGCKTVDDFKKETAFELERRGKDGFVDWYFDYQAGNCDDKGKVLCLYDYKDGSRGSVYVELTPFVDEYKDEKGETFYDLELSYVVYEEYDGNVRECGSISIEDEATLLSALEETIEVTSTEFSLL